MNTIFDKIYCLDTNIILNDYQNIEILSANGSNLIVLAETVLDELDAKKSGFEEINFQARSFGRFLEHAHVVKTSAEHGVSITRLFINSGKNISIDIIAMEEYKVNTQNAPLNIINDRKILEVVQHVKETNNVPVIFISNDIMCRQRGISLGIHSEPMRLNVNDNIQINHKLEDMEHKPSYKVFDIQAMDVPCTVQTLEVVDTNNVSAFYYRSNGLFNLVTDDMFRGQWLQPKNAAQKLFNAQMLDESINLLISDAPAGSGKTLLALTSAMRLMDIHKDKYSKIVYIRKTVISDDAELGFLPGSLEEKMSGYLAPLYSNIEFLVEKKYSNKKEKLTKEELDAKIEEVMLRYNIQSMYEGHLRGTNIRDAIVILDEFQNNSISSAKTILTRMADNCKVVVLGSNRQIDSKYLNKHNNALTYLLQKLGQDTMGVNISAVQLTKTIRSAIAEWADTFK